MFSAIKRWFFEMFIAVDVWVRLLIAFLIVFPLRVFLFDSWLVPFMPFFVAIFMESVRKFFPTSRVYYVIYAYVMIGILVLVVVPWSRGLLDEQAHEIYGALIDRAKSEKLVLADTIQPPLDLEIERAIVEQSHTFQNAIAKNKLEQVKIINEKIKAHSATLQDVEEAKRLLQELKGLRKGTGLDPIPEPPKAPSTITPLDKEQKNERTRPKVALAPESAPPSVVTHSALIDSVSEQERLHMDDTAYQEYRGLLAIQNTEIIRHPIKVHKPPVMVRKNSIIIVNIKNAILSTGARVGEFVGTLPKGLYIGAFKVAERDTPVHGTVVASNNDSLLLTLMSVDASPFALAIRASCTYANSIFTEASSSGDSDIRTLRFVIDEDVEIPEDFFTTRP